MNTERLLRSFSNRTPVETSLCRGGNERGHGVVSE